MVGEKESSSTEARARIDAHTSSSEQRRDSPQPAPSEFRPVQADPLTGERAAGSAAGAVPLPAPSSGDAAAREDLAL